MMMIINLIVENFIYYSSSPVISESINTLNLAKTSNANESVEYIINGIGSKFAPTLLLIAIVGFK